jgi:hypothetical protein
MAQGRLFPGDRPEDITPRANRQNAEEIAERLRLTEIARSGAEPGEWYVRPTCYMFGPYCAELKDASGTGAQFYGARARELAIEYAAWKNKPQSPS